MKLDQLDNSKVPKDEMQDGGLSLEDPINLHSKVPLVTLTCLLDSEFSEKSYKVVMFIWFMQKLQDDLQTMGMKIQLHEDNIRFLRTLKDKLVDSIIDLQGILFFRFLRHFMSFPLLRQVFITVILGKYHASNTPKIENKDGSDTQSEDKPSDQKQILLQENTAASILCHLKTNPKMLASDPTLSDDVLGVVAELGNVDDNTLNRSLLLPYICFSSFK